MSGAKVSDIEINKGSRLKDGTVNAAEVFCIKRGTEGAILEITSKGRFEMKSLVARPMNTIMESLILAQNERWRRVLNMQVERQKRGLPLFESGGLVSNTWVTYLLVGDSY